MTQRVRLYSPDGQPFDVPEYRRAHLVLEKGFSQTPPDEDANAERLVTVSEPASPMHVQGSMPDDEDEGEHEGAEPNGSEEGDDEES